MPEWRTNLAGTFYTGDHVGRVSLRYVDEYKNDNSGNAPIDSWTTVDLLYSYTFAGLIGDGDTTVTIGMNNAFDEDPPALTRCQTVVNNACTETVPRFRLRSISSWFADPTSSACSVSTRRSIRLRRNPTSCG